MGNWCQLVVTAADENRKEHVMEEHGLVHISTQTWGSVIVAEP